MNIVLWHAARLAAISVLALTPTFASGVERDGSLKMAMGPTSAAQKNQGRSADIIAGESRPVPSRHPSHHRTRHHHPHSM